MLLEAVAKRGGYATLSELMRDALIHISHYVLNRAAYPNRSTELAAPEPFRPMGCGEEKMTIETDIRSLAVHGYRVRGRHTQAQIEMLNLRHSSKIVTYLFVR